MNENVKIVSEWRVAKAKNGNMINVKIVPLKRKQNALSGFVWVEVGQTVQLESGQQIEFNQDGHSFYTSPNQLYRLI